jgi:chromatin modification-related protein VID21
VLPSAPRDPAKRVADSNWIQAEDELLKMLAQKYPKNWGLISDTFNTLRSAISTERRQDWECKERYRLRFKQRSDEQHPSQEEFYATPSASTVRPQVTTRKRLASMNTGAQSPTPGPGGIESRKRRRHHFMFDAMRKVERKRQSAAKANGMISVNPEIYNLT